MQNLYDDEKILEAYFDYIYSISGLNVNDAKPNLSKRSFALKLHSIDFIPYDDGDKSRSIDGLRYRDDFLYTLREAFISEIEYEEYKKYIKDLFADKPCSFFEFLLGIAGKIENIMSDPLYPDRHSQWMSKMIVSLGIGGFTQMWIDKNPDWEHTIETAIDNFHHRNYEANGKGGLFHITTPLPEGTDMRTMPVWNQAMFYTCKIANT